MPKENYAHLTGLFDRRLKYPSHAEILDMVTAGSTFIPEDVIGIAIGRVTDALAPEGAGLVEVYLTIRGQQEAAEPNLKQFYDILCRGIDPVENIATYAGKPIEIGSDGWPKKCNFGSHFSDKDRTIDTIEPIFIELGGPRVLKEYAAQRVLAIYEMPDTIL